MRPGLLSAAPATMAIAVGLLVGAGWWILPVIGVTVAVLILAPPRSLIISGVTIAGVLPAVTGPQQVLLSAAISGLIVAAILLNPARSRAARPGPVLALAGYVALSTLWTDSSLGVALIAYLPIALVATSMWTWPATIKDLSLALIAAGTLQSILALLALASVDLGTEKVTQVGGFAQPIPIAAAMLALGALGRTSSHRWRQRWAKRLRVLAAINLAGIVATESVGMLIGTGAGIAVLGATRAISPQPGSTSRVPLRAAAMRGLVVTALLTPLGVAIATRFPRFGAEPLAAPLAARVIEAGFAMDLYSRHPILGHGIGTTFLNPISGVGDSQLGNYVHNSVLYFAIVGGLVGASLFLIVIVGTLIRLVRSARTSGFAAALAGVFVYSLTQAIVRTSQFNILLAICVVVAVRESGSWEHREAGVDPNEAHESRGSTLWYADRAGRQSNASP